MRQFRTKTVRVVNAVEFRTPGKVFRRLPPNNEQPFHNPVKEGLPTIHMVKTLQALADCEFGWGF